MDVAHCVLPDRLESCVEEGPWLLVPEGAAVCRAQGVAVVADLHLGYEWARGRGGDVIPAHSLAETISKIEAIFERVAIRRLVVAGDLRESAAPCPATTSDIERLRGWLRLRSVELIALNGNHDPGPLETLDVAGWRIAHGHRPISASHVILGHHHPALRVAGVCAPCFLTSPRTIVLPAFSENAAGLDLAVARLPASLRGQPLRCLASTGQELLDFGPVVDLRKRLVRKRISRA